MKNRGFTLIEMALVLVILGLILGIGINSIIFFIKWNKTRATREKLSSAVDTVIGFAETNKYLPDATDFSSVFGEKDEFGQNFIYVYSHRLTKSFFQTFESKGYDVSICDVKNSQLKFSDNNTNSTLPNIAFIIFSKGEDYQSNTYCNNDLITNSKKCNGEITTDSSKDIVKVVTLPELKQRIGCIGIPLKILNNSLPEGVVGEPYNATIVAKGGLPFLSGGSYEWCYKTTSTDTKGLIFHPDKQCNDNDTSWEKSDEFEISGTPNSSGTIDFKVCVRDNNGPKKEDKYKTCKLFTITINNPSESSNGTSSNGDYDLEINVRGWPLTEVEIPSKGIKECTGNHYGLHGLAANDRIIINYNTACPEGIFGFSFPIINKTAQLMDKNKDHTIEINCNCYGLCDCRFE